MKSLYKRSILDIHSLSAEEFLYIVDEAARLKKAKKLGQEHPALKGKNVVLIFEKDSTRTRCAFEVGAYDQGAHVTYLGPGGSHMGSKESVKDTARVLGRMYDAIEYRGFAQKTVEDLALYSGVPVWNGLTDLWHPTQMFADLLTMIEHGGAKKASDISFAYVGDARNNMSNSFLIMGALLGMDVRLGAPKAIQPEADILHLAQKLAEKSHARITITDDAAEAVRGVDYVHTDVWVSMGEPDAIWEERIRLLGPYQVNAALMKAAGTQARFMHCLPAFHNDETKKGRELGAKFGLSKIAEVTEDVFESPACIAFDQAENRMHTIKAMMVATLSER